MKRYRIYIYGNKKEHSFLRIFMELTTTIVDGDEFENETFFKAVYVKGCLSPEEEIPSGYRAAQLLETEVKCKYNKLSLYDTFCISI